MTVEIDLSRPPARIGPRIPPWATMAMILGGTLALIVVAFGLLSEVRVPQLVVPVLLAACALNAVGIYVRLWLLRGWGFWSTGWLGRGYDVRDPDDDRRPPGPEERSARRRLRRGAITRREYERIIARRHSVHGEYSAAEYPEAMRQVDEQVPAVGAEAPPPVARR